MAQYFLGSVGQAEAFRHTEDGFELMFTSKTLMESGLSVGITKDQVRGGEGASIQFEFAHDPSVDIRLVDALFKTDYIETQLGIDFSEVGDENNEAYHSENVIFTDGQATLSSAVCPLPLVCDGKVEYIAWGCKQNDDEWYMLGVNPLNTKQIFLPGASGKYCVSYLTKDMNARVAEITTNMVPDEFFLIITAPVFAGDPNSASFSSSIGYIQFEVPRFQPNGTLDFSFEMSSHIPMIIEGQALATPNYSSQDDDRDVLLKVRQVILNKDWTDEIVEIYIDPDTAITGEMPVFYAILKSKETIKLNLCDMIFRESSTGSYVYNIPQSFVFDHAGTYYFNLYDGKEFIAEHAPFNVFDEDTSAQRPLMTLVTGHKLPNDLAVVVEDNANFSDLYYNDDIYFI